MKNTIAFFGILFFLVSCNKGNKISLDDYLKLSDDQKRSTEFAVEGIELKDPELEVSLFASEPMMSNPTNMDIDDKGRVWICEAYNYRNELNPRNPYKKAGDRILILEDTNRDGKADKSKVFYQGEDINAALGISVQEDKVIVSVSPYVYVFKDTNHDDVADSKEILFQGIGGKQHDHGMHSFTFGPDGKYYFNYGNAGQGLKDNKGNAIKDDLGRIVNGDGKPYREGMVYRCDQDGKNVEILAWNFRNNYEVAVNSYGTMWQSDNDDDGNRSTRINYVMDYGNYGYKDEISGADWRVRRTNLEDSVYKQHWHLNDPGVVPNFLQTYAGSPTGILVYEGDLLPKKYKNQIIHCDAGPNVLRAYSIKKDGAGYEGEIIPILDGSKRDQWFRPSDVTVAPDGSLFVSDWYDPGVGGHAMGDTLKGRIYRIAPKGVNYSIPKFNYNTVEGAINALKNANLHVRAKAWNALNKMGAKAEKALLDLYNGDDQLLKARSLWLLSIIPNKAKHYINLALNDKNEDIVAQAIKISRQNTFDLVSEYKKASSHSSIQVKRELAIAIRHKKLPEIWNTLTKSYDGKDRWYLEALGISADNDWDIMLKNWKIENANTAYTIKANQDILWRARHSESLEDLAKVINNVSITEKPKFYRAFDFNESNKKNEILLDLLSKSKDSDEKVLIFRHFDSKSIMKNPKFLSVLPSVVPTIKDTLDYIDIVDRYQLAVESKKLNSFVFGQTSRKVFEEAIKTLMKFDGLKRFESIVSNGTEKDALLAIEKFGFSDTPLVTEYLIKIFSNKKLPISYRKEAMKAMNGWESEEKLWSLVKANKVDESVMPEAKEILTRTWHSDIRVAATNMFEKLNPSAAVDVKSLISQKGNSKAGYEIFKMYCTSCHKVNAEGVDFGPGLSQIGKKLSKEGLYNAILYPSEGISFGYEANILKLKDGTEAQGIVTSKTENEYLLKYPGSASIVKIKRNEVKELIEIKESLMPKFQLKNKEYIDLVSYLETLK
jgi:putative membrane-bound dehydrogenase-like protein